jgi:hypothetical protein
MLAGILLICANQAVSQEMRIGAFIPAVEGVESEEDKTPLEVFNRTLSYYLDICTTCTAVEFDTQLEETTEDALAKLSADFDLDSIIFFSPSAIETDLTGAAFNLYRAGPGTTRTMGLQDFDLSSPQFTAAHRLLESLLDEILDIKDSWGVLELTARGAKGHFSVEIGGISAGDNINSPIAVPSGTHVIEVMQKRPFGTQILLEERATIETGSTEKMNFAIPELTDLEQRAFDAIDSKILDSWESDAEAVEEQFDLLESLFEGIRASNTVSGYRDKYKTWKTEYQAGQGASTIIVEAPIEDTEREEIAADIEKDLDLSVAIKEPLPIPGFGSILLASMGPLIDRTGSVIHALVHDSMFTEDKGGPTPFSYANLTYDIAGEDGAYFWTVLGLWGGAGVAESLLFPYRQYTLSPGGKAVYAAGIALDTIGGFLTLFSRIAGANWVMAEDDLSSGKSGPLALDPDEYRTAQAFTGYSGYAAWVLGTAASVAAPFIPGERSMAVSGGFQKFLYVTGSILDVLGNLTSFIAYNSRLLADIRSRAYDYADFSTDNDKSYERYETAHAFYLGSTIATYSLWGLGALSSILAIVLPEPPPTAADSPVDETRPEPLFSIDLRIERDYAGVTLWL